MRFLPRAGDATTFKKIASPSHVKKNAHDQAAKYDSKLGAAMLNFGLLWRGISVGSDAL